MRLSVLDDNPRNSVFCNNGDGSSLLMHANGRVDILGDVVSVAYLDGKPEPFVQVADEDEGYVICDAVVDGCLVISAADEFETVTKHGKVEIKFLERTDPVVEALPRYRTDRAKFRDENGKLHDEPKRKQADGLFGWAD